MPQEPRCIPYLLTPAPLQSFERVRNVVLEAPTHCGGSQRSEDPYGVPPRTSVSGIMPTSFKSILYVSESLLDASEREEELDKILALSMQRNPATGVTGALIFTGAHFTQIIEGTGAAVDELMSRIVADRRHTKVDVVESVQMDCRRFPDWSMAYSGPSEYVIAHVHPLCGQFTDPRTRVPATRSLIRLMLEFTSAGGVRQYR